MKEDIGKTIRLCDSSLKKASETNTTIQIGGVLYW